MRKYWHLCVIRNGYKRCGHWVETPSREYIQSCVRSAKNYFKTNEVYSEYREYSPYFIRKKNDK